jgi:hypothetical protein
MKAMMLFAITTALLITAGCQPQEQEDARVAAHALAQAQRENDQMWKDVDAAQARGIGNPMGLHAKKPMKLP